MKLLTERERAVMNSVSNQKIAYITFIEKGRAQALADSLDLPGKVVEAPDGRWIVTRYCRGVPPHRQYQVFGKAGYFKTFANDTCPQYRMLVKQVD